MIRDFFTNIWVLGCIGLLIILSVCCWLYYYNIVSEVEKGYSALEQLTEENSMDSQVSIDAGSDTSAVQQSSNAIRKSRDNVNVVVNDTSNPNRRANSSNTQMQVTVTEVSDTKEIAVSPHGLGPYPKIPDIWPQDLFERKKSLNQELITRVRIQLYEEGTYTYGAGIDKATGLVYPITKDRVYVNWHEQHIPGRGHVRYATTLKGHPDLVAEIRSNATARNPDLPSQIVPVTEADIPQGIDVLSESDGINPYEFLNIQRQ